MFGKNIERYLNKLGKFVVDGAKANLIKDKKNVTGALLNSIEFKIKKEQYGYSLGFYMFEYGEVVDKGANGQRVKRKYKDWEGKMRPTPGAGFYGKQPPADAIFKWVKKRRIRGRVDKNWKGAGNRGGQFIKDLNLAYLIARRIKIRGIQGISFYQQPLELGWRKYGEEFLEFFGFDVIDELNNITQ
jgi:hypothetical protein|tara:strand:- start:50 stop:610 length:561 start_codon:yes stop_codon:yes gene_type:complete